MQCGEKNATTNAEIDVDAKVEQPDPSDTEDQNIPGFGDKNICFNKGEKRDYVELNVITMQSIENIAIIKAEIDVDVKKEQPDLSDKEDDCVSGFHEKYIRLKKPEGMDPVASDVITMQCEEKNTAPKVEIGIDFKEERRDSSDTEYNTYKSMPGFNDKTICFINPQERVPVKSDVKEFILKEFRILLTRFIFSCVLCDRLIDSDGPMPVWRHNNEAVLVCSGCRDPKKKNFICVKCERVLSTKQKLLNHVYGIHLKLKKFKCHDCNIAFTTTSNLKVHVDSIHRKVRYECRECGKSFSQNSHLATHVNFKHRKSIVFTCEECNKAFATKTELTKHINGVHLRMRNYKCEQCEFACYKRSALTRHTNSVHRKLKPFACEECNRHFGQRYELMNHVNHAHLD